MRSAILLTDECTQEFWAHLAGAGRVVPRRQVQSIEGLSLERMKAMAILKGPTLETLHQLEEAPNSLTDLEYDVNHVRRRLVSLSAGQGQVRFVTQPKPTTTLSL